MASKTKTVYICNECGYESAKWLGKCPSCNSWNTMEEQVVSSNGSTYSVVTSAAATPLSKICTLDEPRYITGISELDRVLGGGIVKGSVTLLSGDPGIGKSTILLQICNALQNKFKILYVSGEESATQIKMRATRIGIESDKVSVMTETDVVSICEYIKSAKPDLVMIDSIQTMQIAELSSSVGSIVQVRESTNMLLRTGKSLEIPIIIVGHVNKGGEIAGPKVMEHIVDTVLYFEGERNQSYRILRGIKNRFGSTNEIGVFEMTEVGLKEVENPSAMLLSGRMSNVSGGCITCVMEGTRPILAEVQGLVTPSGFGNPRRTSTGFDYNRLNLLLAVLEKRIGLNLSNMDAYVNIVGGMRLDEPAADIAIALALISSLTDKIIPDDLIAIGEIGLSGECRGVANVSQRVKEASRLGFTKAVIPIRNYERDKFDCDIQLIPVKNIYDILKVIKSQPSTN